MLLRVLPEYRITSAEALCVISGVIPSNVLINESTSIYWSNKADNDVSVSKREDTVKVWQDQMNTRATEWTKNLLPDIDSWVKCEFQRLGYFSTRSLWVTDPFVYYIQVGRSSGVMSFDDSKGLKNAIEIF